MYATKNFGDLDFHAKLAVTTEELQARLSCGRYAAVRLGTAAGARIQIGKRVFWNVKRIETYLNEISV